MRFHRKSILMIALGIAASGMGAAFAYHNFSHGDHRVPTKYVSELEQNGSELVVRAYRIPTDGPSDSEVSFTGSVQPRYQTSVGFRVAGKVAQRHIELGDCVKQGDLLFSLDPTDYDLNLRVAESDLISAQSTFTQAAAEEKRLLQLRSTGAVSLSEYDLSLAARDVSQARLDSARKRLELAQNQRDYCELRADFDGLVTAIQGESGQVVNVGQTVLQLMQGEELEAVISIPENRLDLVRNRRPTISIWSQPDARFPAKLREIAPIADPISRTYDAKFTLPESASKLSIGMTATVHLFDSNPSDIPIPTAAIGNSLDEAVVWRIREQDGSVEAIPIEVAQIRNDTAMVRGPLRPNDLVVSAGVQRIDEKVRVRVWNSQ
ncbi:efflux RND transporter periplasmic adaptor subunit [Pirellulaceae bacterium SH467]